MASGNDESIDFWKEPAFSEQDVQGPFLCESEFKLMFPDYRLHYIQANWDLIKSILSDRRLSVDLDVVNKSMTVMTTKTTYDPYAIIKGRDFLKLIARSVPVEAAKRIFDDQVFAEIVKIGGIVANKERFARRRQRLVGPDGATLKVLELLTDCYICVSGQTCSIIGSWKGVRRARQVVLDCMHNMHPVYQLKTLMVEKELQKNPALKNEDWTNYLPRFQKQRPRKQQSARTPTAKKSAKALRRD